NGTRPRPSLADLTVDLEPEARPGVGTVQAPPGSERAHQRQAAAMVDTADHLQCGPVVANLDPHTLPLAGHRDGGCAVPVQKRVREPLRYRELHTVSGVGADERQGDTADLVAGCGHLRERSDAERRGHEVHDGGHRPASECSGAVPAMT